MYIDEALEYCQLIDKASKKVMVLLPHPEYQQLALTYMDECKDVRIKIEKFKNKRSLVKYGVIFASIIAISSIGAYFIFKKNSSPDHSKQN